MLRFDIAYFTASIPGGADDVYPLNCKDIILKGNLQCAYYGLLKSSCINVYSMKRKEKSTAKPHKW